MLFWCLPSRSMCSSSVGKELTPAIVGAPDTSLSHDRRQVTIVAGVTVGSLAVGMYFGRVVQYKNDRNSHKPGFGNAPGSVCYQEGPWTLQQPVLELVNYACVLLTSRALQWAALHNNTLANPDVSMRRFANGTLFRDENGTPRVLTFLMLDVNGERGRPWYGKEQCVLAMQTLMYDCGGDHADTRGGMYYYGHDGVVGYGFTMMKRLVP